MQWTSSSQFKPYQYVNLKTNSIDNHSLSHTTEPPPPPPPPQKKKKMKTNKQTKKKQPKNSSNKITDKNTTKHN